MKLAYYHIISITKNISFLKFFNRSRFPGNPTITPVSLPQETSNGKSVGNPVTIPDWQLEDEPKEVNANIPEEHVNPSNVSLSNTEYGSCSSLNVLDTSSTDFKDILDSPDKDADSSTFVHVKEEVSFINGETNEEALKENIGVEEESIQVPTSEETSEDVKENIEVKKESIQEKTSGNLPDAVKENIGVEKASTQEQASGQVSEVIEKTGKKKYRVDPDLLIGYSRRRII